jgi:hypothetical protein
MACVAVSYAGDETFASSSGQIPVVRPLKPTPSLPWPGGALVDVATEAQLQAAVRSLASNTTIVIAPGTYVLSSTLVLGGTYTNIAIRGATDHADDVVLIGPGMAQANYGNVPFGIWTGGNVQGVTIANLTIRDLYYHPIILNPGTRSPRIFNVHLIDAGEQFIKSNPDGAGGGVNDGIVEYSVLEYTTTAKDDYTNGVDVHTGANWIIRHNVFRNIVAPSGLLAGPSVLMWNHSSNTLTEGNLFLNCARGISYGLIERGIGNDHQGGIISNNVFYRSNGQPGDVAIHVADSPNTQVLNNTVFVSGTYATPIEYRYASSTGTQVINNITDGSIWARQGATGTESHNLAGATATLFVAAASGDLHLVSTAAAAIDQGLTIANVVDDWDGKLRPHGAASDIGADEYGASLPAGRLNVALAANGATAVASSSYSANYPASAAINGDRKGLGWGTGGGWNDATLNAYPDWLEVDFSGPKTIEEIDVFSVQDNYAAPSEPTPSMSFSLYGLTDFQVQYWTGTEWLALPSGIVSGNSLVWRRITFGALATSRIRIYVTGALNTYSRLTEIEAYQPPAGRANVALASNGATAVASSSYSASYPASAAINGDRSGLGWGTGGGWNDATLNTYPDWLEVDFSGPKTIDQIDVFSVQDRYAAPSEPTPSMTFSLYGLTDFHVQYWTGTQWLDVPGGIVSGNGLVWRQITFAALTTSRIRVYVTGALNLYSRLTEVEAYQVSAS